ncbi:flavodoxin family protein [Desulfoferrobacter suflitae]|uniref:flavodoxin family protein n=1 Tax=Desulfoferrobacter suflitae TaxID=2865782 RepID=UPI0021645F75|nr:flavodoxin family protein [Desulfoferrobacter suflitae]MCK8602197.1 flavodoxin family protein [Desulfoferrobacter suflitae]
MRVLGIYGSPRKGGNTDAMLDAFLRGAADCGATPERLYVRDVQIQPCIGCGHCDKAGSCVQQDAMVEVYFRLERADGIVVASPIYFYSVTAQLKALIDRSQAPLMKKKLAQAAGAYHPRQPPRKGFLLSAAATRGKRLFDCAVLPVRYFFDALDVHYAGELCFPGIEERRAIEKHPAALQDCRRAGRAFVSHTAP